MAFDNTQSQAQDDEQQQAQANQSQGQSATNLSGGGAGFAGQVGSQGAPNTSTQSKPSSSGSWTNLNQYLDANQDQSQALGTQVANNLSGQAQKAQGDLSNVQQGFGQKYAGVNSTTDQTVDAAFTDPSQYATGDTSQAEKYLGDAGGWGLGQNSGDLSSYGGYGDAIGEYQNTAANLQNSQTEGGRDFLLQNQFGHNGQSYGAGLQNFDQLLLQQDPQNQAKLGDVYNQYASHFVPNSATGQASDITNALSQASSQDQQARSKIAELSSRANQDLTGSANTFATHVGGETTDKNAIYGTTAEGFKKDLEHGDLPPDLAAQLGLPTGRLDTYGANLTGAYTQPASLSPYTNASAASTQDWQTYAGLQNLINGMKGGDQAADNSIIGGLGLGAGQSAAPTVASPYSGFDEKKFMNEVGTNKSAYDTALQNDYNALRPVAGFGAGDNPTLDQLVQYFQNYEAGPSYAGSAERAPDQWSQVNSALGDYLTQQNKHTYIDGNETAPSTNPKFRPVGGP